MDKEQARKEFNEFLDSASDATIKDFLKFIKERRAKKEAEENSSGVFKNRKN